MLRKKVSDKEMTSFFFDKIKIKQLLQRYIKYLFSLKRCHLSILHRVS